MEIKLIEGLLLPRGIWNIRKLGNLMLLLIIIMYRRSRRNSQMGSKINLYSRKEYNLVIKHYNGSFKLLLIKPIELMNLRQILKKYFYLDSIEQFDKKYI